jgi:hypothetical protein
MPWGAKSDGVGLIFLFISAWKSYFLRIWDSI